MEGYEATRKIRQFNQVVVIIAQTTFALSADKQRAIAAGCNDFIANLLAKRRWLNKSGSKFCQTESGKRNFQVLKALIKPYFSIKLPYQLIRYWVNPIVFTSDTKSLLYR